MHALDSANRSDPHVPAAPDTDPVIGFWESRMQAAPQDPSLPVRLAGIHLERARYSHDHRDYARAELAAGESLRRAPDNLPALLMLGSSYLGQHRFEDALELAGRTLSRYPGARGGLALRGDARLGLHQLVGARADYAALLQQAPDLLAWARMANLQFAEGDVQAAMVSLETGIRLGGERAVAPKLLGWALVRLGELRFRSGDWEGAGLMYARAEQFGDPDDPDLLDHLAELHAARGEFVPALELSTRAHTLAPRPEFLQARGDIHAAMGEAQHAREFHQQALAAYLMAAQDGHGHYYHHLAGLYSDAPSLRDPAQALKWANKDLQLRRTPATLEAVAWALYQAGSFEQAAARMDEALQWKTADAHILYHASLIQARVGNNARSRELLLAAAAANPRFNEFHFHR